MDANRLCERAPREPAWPSGLFWKRSVFAEAGIPTVLAVRLSLQTITLSRDILAINDHRD